MEINDPRFKIVVLSGGGIKGLVQLGVLHYYHQTGLYDLAHITTFVGTSVGFVNCILLSLGYNPFDIFIEVYHMKGVDIKDFNNIWGIVEKGGLLPISVVTDRIGPMILRKLREKYQWIKPDFPTLDELHNLTGKTIICTVGNVSHMTCEYYSHVTKPHVTCIDAIAHTCCLPLVFQPIEYEGCFVADGASMDNFPLAHVDDKTSKILAILTTGTNIPWPASGFIGYIYRLMLMANKRVVEFQCSNAGDNVTLIRLQYDGLSTFDFAISLEQKKELFRFGFTQVFGENDNNFDQSLSEELFDNVPFVYNEAVVLDDVVLHNVAQDNVVQDNIDIALDDTNGGITTLEEYEKLLQQHL